MPKYPLIHVKYARKILKSTRRSCKHLAIQIFPERKWLPGMRWDNFSSHTITLFVNGAFIQLSKLAKSGSWHCHLQWPRSCVTYLMQERYQKKEDELLFTYMSRGKFSNHLTLKQWAFDYGLPFFWYALYRLKSTWNINCQICYVISLGLTYMEKNE